LDHYRTGRGKEKTKLSFESSKTHERKREKKNDQSKELQEFRGKKGLRGDAREGMLLALSPSIVVSKDQDLNNTLTTGRAQANVRDGDRIHLLRLWARGRPGRRQKGKKGCGKPALKIEANGPKSWTMWVHPGFRKDLSKRGNDGSGGTYRNGISKFTRQDQGQSCK